MSGHGFRRVALAATLVLCAACSSGGPTPVSMPGSVVNKGTVNLGSAAAPSVTVNMGDDWFSPSFVKAAPGTAVTVTVVEEGDVAHTFTIDGQNIDVALSKKGDRHTVTVTLPANGKPLIFYCKYHRSVGMQGALYS
ncbi:MAG TPA: cupredoxin domain-containing protein [Actinomycetota bacterium]|nr:cupredoxin domain-containing protein [Actinomycetota bacterium]